MTLTWTTPSRRRISFVALLMIFCAASLLANEQKAFDIPSGSAENTLRQFTTQSGTEVIYVASAVRGVKTAKLKGNYAPIEALRLLLEATPLVFTQDNRGQTFIVSRRSNPQDKSPPPGVVPQQPRAAGTEEAIALSPFEVTTSNDDGYIARNTLSASGMNIAVKDLPQSIEIVTSEMIEDLGAVRLDEVLRFSAAYTPDGHDSTGIAGATIRGFANAFTLRDGFRVRSGNSDTFNMDRVEIVKGAAAVLYGVSEPGGMVNYVVKKPEQRDFTRLAYTRGSYNFSRGTLDFNKHMELANQGLTFRLLAVAQTSEDQIPWADDNQDFIAPKVTWHPLKDVRIDASYEYSKREAFFAGRMPSYATTTRMPDGTNVTRTYLFDPDVYDFGWDSQGPSAFNNTTTRTLTFGAEARLHATTLLRANFQQSKTHQHVFQRGGTNAALTGGNFSRYPGGVDPAPGEPRSIDGAYNHNSSRDRYTDWRIEALTQLTSFLGKHDFFYGWEQNEQVQLYNAQVVPASARVQSSTRPVFVDWLRYVTVEQLADILRFDQPTPQGVVAPIGLVTRTGGAYIMTRHSLLQDRLTLSVGARFDEDNQGKDFLGISNSGHVGQYGAVYQITPQISAYGLYNESFIPQAPGMHAGVLLPLANGSFSIPPAVGLTREVGVKADFGKVTVSAAAFVIRSGGRALKMHKVPGGTGNNPEDFMTVLAGLDRSSGFEVSAAAHLFAGYQITGSYAQQHARIVSDVAFPVNNGKPLRSSPEHSFAAQNRYDFRDGPLKGLNLGFGVRYSSSSQMELADSTGSFDTKIRPSYVAWNGFAGYKTKVWDRPVTFRLTINNLENKKYWLERNRLADPRMWRLSVDTQF